jgi:hypothetical protein
LQGHVIGRAGQMTGGNLGQSSNRWEVLYVMCYLYNNYTLYTGTIIHFYVIYTILMLLVLLYSSSLYMHYVLWWLVFEELVFYLFRRHHYINITDVL